MAQIIDNPWATSWARALRRQIVGRPASFIQQMVQLPGCHTYLLSQPAKRDLPATIAFVELVEKRFKSQGHQFGYGLLQRYVAFLALPVHELADWPLSVTATVSIIHLAMQDGLTSLL